ncbi:acyl- n-acyltransferase [Lecanosticta acicola]|uniref:Acyl- n-acyltransferase n=1 Tax=Lecanosticta acicola TaxID=111012 RepID=A0AAI8Z9I2_9PEZI|nr:acyl- n-acyltransferase [Lecanosticta acicola]
MASTLRVEPALEEDIPRLMEIVAPAFGDFSYSQLIGETNTPSDRNAMGQRQAYAWKEHLKHYKLPIGIKCTHIEPATGSEKIISSANWVIYDRARTEEEYLEPHCLVGADWVQDEKRRERAKSATKSVVQGRIRWMGGRPHGLLMYMATDPAYRRLGAATKIVQWGLERCRELGIPAYLEASDEGAPVYEKLGFEMVDSVYFDDYQVKVMIRWPPGTKEEDKKPTLPNRCKIGAE